MKKLKLVCNCLILAWFGFGISSAFGQKELQIDQALSKYLDVQNKRIGFSGVVIIANNCKNNEAERLKLRIFAPIKLWCRRTVNCSESPHYVQTQSSTKTQQKQTP